MHICLPIPTCFNVPADLSAWKYRIKMAAFNYWAREWNCHTMRRSSLRYSSWSSLSPSGRKQGFLLGNNHLNKQLARIRMDYVSPNGFLFQHGLSLITTVMVASASATPNIYNLALMFFFHAPPINSRGWCCLILSNFLSILPIIMMFLYMISCMVNSSSSFFYCIKLKKLT